MSDNEDDVGMTMAMDMIAKLNGEHAEVFASNLRLEKEIQDLKDKAAKIWTSTCSLCEKEKKSQFREYNKEGYENHNPSKGDGSDDFEDDIKDLEEFNTDTVAVTAHLCQDCYDSVGKGISTIRINNTRSEMIKWGQKFSKNHKLTDYMVREHARIKRDIGGVADISFDNENRDVYGDYPCYFANLHRCEEDIAWAMYHYAIG
jgi:hypothetical protein